MSLLDRADMKTGKPAARPDAAQGSAPVDPNLGHHPLAPSAPDPEPPRSADTWQTYDITLLGRRDDGLGIQRIVWQCAILTEILRDPGV